MASEDDSEPMKVLEDLCGTYGHTGQVELCIATQGEQKSIARHEFALSPIEAINLGQRLISSGVRAMQAAMAGKVI